ncbi:hypothetical protein ACN28I_42355 [Archangium gephyra]|uniref:hypothetical protein n=1 Tax=Archangium gephyra TaxID=48 RepID=UPI003B773ED2
MIVDVGRIKQGTEYTVSVAVDQKNEEPAFVSVGWQPILEMDSHPYSYQMNIEPGRAGAHTQQCPPASEYCNIEILVELHEGRDARRGAGRGDADDLRARGSNLAGPAEHHPQRALLPGDHRVMTIPSIRGR